MKKITDKTRARMLLETRERGGYKALPFIRTNAKGYLFIVIYVSVFLAFLAFTDAWVAFGYVAFFVAGILLRDVSWFIGIRRSWPFLSKIVNWDEVKKISDDEPSA
jgi:hypothetical protein